MPKRDVKEVSHSVLTNHRILRETGERFPDATFSMTSARLPDLVQLDGMPGRNDALIPPIILLQAYGQLMGAHPEYRERYVALAEELRHSTPNDIYVLEALAYGALAKNGEEGTQQAIEYLTRAIGQGSTLPGDFEQLGNLLMNARRFPEGAELIALGIKTIPHDGELHRLLGVCYLAQNRTAEARDVLMRASQRFPENDAIRTLLADSEKSTR
jgi:tetratricopeptide (TPR) repeat protein